MSDYHLLGLLVSLDLESHRLGLVLHLALGRYQGRAQEILQQRGRALLRKDLFEWGQERGGGGGVFVSICERVS